MITSARIRGRAEAAGSLDHSPQGTQIRLPRYGPFSFRCLTRATSPRSPPEFPASAWSVQRTATAEERARQAEICAGHRGGMASWPTRSPAEPAQGQDKIGPPSGASKNRTTRQSCSTSPSPKTASPLGNQAHTAEEARTRRLLCHPHQRRGQSLGGESVVAPIRARPRRARLPHSQTVICTCDRSTMAGVAGARHVFLCMLACHVEWHMRECLKPMLSTTTIRLVPHCECYVSKEQKPARSPVFGRKWC